MLPGATTRESVWDGGSAPKPPPCRGQKDPVRRFQLILFKPIRPHSVNLSQRTCLSLRSFLEATARQLVLLGALPPNPRPAGSRRLSTDAF
jgi:hypothetical protein